jgi:outer membrane biosynthesis protein TonB
VRALLAGVILLGQDVSPARLIDGKPPGLSPLASTGGIVGLELRIAASGIVREVVVIDDAPPFTDEMRKVIRLWRFDAARAGGRRIESRVAVVGVFRGPTLMGGGEPPTPGARAHAPSDDIPYPLQTATPDYPPQALYGGVIMMEVEVGGDGTIANVELLTEEDGFSAAALEAVRKFRFQRAPGYVLVAFGFPQPLTTRRPTR